jgi:hypothetical protein
VYRSRIYRGRTKRRRHARRHRTGGESAE